jgi:gliding motility-associated-like protein
MKYYKLTFILCGIILMSNFCAACGFTYTVTPKDAVCGANGSICVTASMGIDIKIFKNNSQIAGVTGSASYCTPSVFPAGFYKVKMKDLGTGCEDSVDLVEIKDISTVNINELITNVSCIGGNDGEVKLINNAPGTTFSWSHSAFEVDSIASPLSAGSVTVTVTLGPCTLSKTFIVKTVDSISLKSKVYNTNCGKIDGAIAVLLTGGNAPYTYVWSNASGNIDSIYGLNVGSFTLTITDSKVCPPKVFNFEVKSNPSPEITIEKDSICPGESNGKQIVKWIKGIPAGAHYEWSHDATKDSVMIEGLLPAGYTVIVTDAGGCKDTATGLVIEIGLKTIAIEGESKHYYNSQTHYLTATPTDDFDDFIWSPDSVITTFADHFKVLIFPKTATTITVEGIYSAKKCKAKKDLIISIDSSTFVFTVPDAFTPNGDQRNDKYTLYDQNKDLGGYDAVENFEIHIYDRWGNEVYTSYDIKEGWDGSDQGNKGAEVRTNMNGVYGYIIKYNLKSDQVNKKVLSGNITMIK